MIEGILLDGLRFMVLGMGVVFSFLTLMVLTMLMAASFFRKFDHLFPETEEKPHANPVVSGDDTEVAIAIAAVHALKQ